jgi:acyl-CoA reductase-like NAD-dependent aldehyde dehydrogenase
MDKYKIYAAGKFVDTPGEIEVRRPYDGKLLARTGIADAILLREVIAKGQMAERPMKEIPQYQRSAILERVVVGMSSKKMVLAELLCQETGKPIRYAISEVERAIQVFKVASEEARRLPGEYISLDWTSAGERKEGWVRHFPIGLIGAISPFNFPLNLSAHKIAPAIATGNPVILKPASQTPVTVLELARIIDQCGLPDGAVSVLPMTRETGSILIQDPRIKLLTFTGSPKVGWKIRQEASRKKVVLELGGNAGVLISESADIEIAVKKCVAGGFSYSGQVCIHVQRIFVHKKLFDQFVSRFIDAVSVLKVGDPLDPSTEISSMIDEINACRVEEWVSESVAAGATVLCGGRREGSFFQPTILTGTIVGMKVCDLEIFGPVVCVEKIDDFSEGIARINDTRYGLQAGIFTNSIEEMDRGFSFLEVGGVIINDVPTFRVDHMPYGGVKDSGVGREGVKYAMLDMLEPRLLVKNKY